MISKLFVKLSVIEIFSKINFLRVRSRVQVIFIAFDRVQNIFVVFHSREFYDIPRVLIADATSRSFEALAAMCECGPYVIHLASISCWYRSDARPDEFRPSRSYLLWISKVRGYGHVCGRWSAKGKKNTKCQLQSNKAHRRHFSNLWLLLVILLFWLVKR